MLENTRQVKLLYRCLRFRRQILVLRHAMEAATLEREREIAALQADLGGVRSELDHWRSTAAKYEEEISRLQEAFTQQQQQYSTATQLQGQQGETHSQSLRSS